MFVPRAQWAHPGGLHVDSNYNTQRTRDKYKHTNLEIIQFDYDKRGKRKKKSTGLSYKMLNMGGDFNIFNVC